MQYNGSRLLVWVGSHFERCRPHKVWFKPSVAVPQLDLDRRSARLLPEVHDRVPNGFICIVYDPRPLGYTVDRHLYVGIRLPAVAIARPLLIVAFANDVPARHYRYLQQRIEHGNDVWSFVPAVPQPVDLQVVAATTTTTPTSRLGVERSDRERESARHLANGAPLVIGVVVGVVRRGHASSCWVEIARSIHRHGRGGFGAKRDRFGARRAELTKEAGGVELLDLASGSCRVILLDNLRQVLLHLFELVENVGPVLYVHRVGLVHLGKPRRNAGRVAVHHCNGRRLHWRRRLGSHARRERRRQRRRRRRVGWRQQQLGRGRRGQG
mmetsp:Transcript_45999/g.148172  ORF Transcript_45999/g.148172 Transcript_45999/m.148172 type:complete len:325 (+) Transcript_45999:848-1822(+)